MDKEAKSTNLYFAFINTISGPFTTNGSIPIVDMVLNQVNNRSDILENYTLSYTNVLDSKVNVFDLVCYVFTTYTLV